MTVPLRERLRRGDVLLGTFAKSPDPNVAEILAGAGLDFLTADFEHSSLNLDQLAHLVRAAALSSVPVLVRLAPETLQEAGRALEAGAAGIQVAGVDDPATIAEACRIASYPPEGGRSLSLSHRAARFGQTPIADYVAAAANELVVVAQIESATAVEALPELLGARRVDAWFLGTTDLSASLGRPGEIDHPDVASVLDRAAAAILESGARLGVFAGDVAGARTWAERGATLIALGSDYTLISRAGVDLVSAWRSR